MGGYIGARAGTLSTTVANVQDVTATDTTPEVTIVNSTHEDTDGGREGKVIFKGQQSGGEESTLAEIQGSHDGTADDEKGDLIFKTNDGSDGTSPTTAMTIDSAQNLGLGTNSPDVRLHVTDSQEQLTLSEGGSKGATFDYRSSTGNLNIATNGIDARANPQMTLDLNGKVIVNRTNSGTTIQTNVPSGQRFNQFDFKVGDVQKGAIWTDDTTDLMGYYVPSGWGKNFYTGGLERMRIDSSGNLLVGTTAVGTDNSNSASIYKQYGQLYLNHSGHGNGTWYAVFVNNGSIIGNIVQSTSSSVAYNTTSDYRLKENVTDVTDGITRVKQLAPKRFNFIADADITVDGFLAHEAATVVPEAITGTKDEVEVWKDGDDLPDGVSVGDNKLDDDGKTIPKMQGIDQSKLVPLLTAALQEAIAKIETLETKVAALEAE